MVIIKVSGGLGNQLFQLAFGMAIEEMYGYIVKYDFSYYRNIPNGDTPRNQYVSKFISKEKIATQDEIKQLIQYDTHIWKKVLKRIGLVEYHTKYERDNDGITSIYQVKDNIVLVGYWQSENYFSIAQKKIRDVFFFNSMKKENKMKIVENMIQQSNSVAIHVRGGDYLTEENKAIFGGICTDAYYKKAYQYIRQLHPDATFFLFTNDIDWCRSNINLPYEEIIVVSELYDATEEWMDLYLMSLCKSNIIANSSYSWWAAWLNQTKDKVVICPQKWTNDMDKNTVVCDSWIKISG